MKHIVVVSLLVVGLVGLVYLEFGHDGLRVVLISLGILFLLSLLFGIFVLGSQTSARHIAMGATLVTRHDAVDAAGDALKLRANGKGLRIEKALDPITVLEEPLRLEKPLLLEMSKEFEIQPFQMSENVR